MRRTAGLTGESRRNTATVQAVISGSIAPCKCVTKRPREMFGLERHSQFNSLPESTVPLPPSRSGPEVTKGWGGVVGERK